MPVYRDVFKPFFHTEYNNLQLYPEAGHLERHIGLLTDLGALVQEEETQKGVLECTRPSHGLFVPIGCRAAYESVWVSTEDGSANGLPQGVPLEPSVVYGPVATNETAYVFCPSEVAATLPHPFQFPLAHDPLGYTLCVPAGRHEAFVRAFRYYFDASGQFVYDNLIHLCVMVKNGGPLFERALTENLPIVDRWTVLDTGSTDGTQDMIRRVLAGKKGRLVEEPFLNFRDSRNRCLELAGQSCKYTLMLDDTYAVRGDLRSFLTTIRSDQFANSYSLLILSNDIEYYSNRVLKTADTLRYMYTIHEVVQQKDNVTVVIPKAAASIFDYRADYMEKRTLERKRYDLDRLFEMLQEDPTNPRHLYYLGQTYNLLEDWANAAKYFELRATSTLIGFKQEAVDSFFELARLYNFKLNKPWTLCEETYRKAYDLDPTRPDPLYFIGVHYMTEGQKRTAYDYLKRAFLLGYPDHAQFSLKPTLAYHFLPKFLAPLCYEFDDTSIGLQACQRFFEKTVTVPNQDPHEGVALMKSWLAVFQHLCQIPPLAPVPVKGAKPLLVFVADGGWGPWTGRDILTKGVGGAETYSIEMARHIQQEGTYRVVVFCRCESADLFEGVEYRPLDEFHSFVASNLIQTCVVNRFSEYLPVAIKGYVENLYFVLHDLGPTGLLVPLHPKLKRIVCLTEWHKEHFLTNFPSCRERTDVVSYGIDTARFKAGAKVPHSFLYSSFPNRGLLPLLQMWPAIRNQWPDATLDVFCDLDHSWTNQVFGEGIAAIKGLLAHGLAGVTMRGWVSKEELAAAWARTELWLYPCTFAETFCLTALEAAISGTLVVCSDLAALQNTVGDRGVVVPGDPMTAEWQRLALDRLFGLGPEEKARLVETNRGWASLLTWKGQAGRFLEQYLKPNLITVADMYNWTHDVPTGSRVLFEQMLRRHTGTGTRLLEIGTYAGTSLVEMLRILPEATAVAIDRWTNYDEDGLASLGKLEERGIERVFYENLRRAGVSGRVQALKGDSVTTLLDLIEQKEPFDFVYVDGSHKCIDCYTDMALSWRLLKTGGTMVIDDYLLQPTIVAQQQSTAGAVLDYPKRGVDHFLSKYEGTYRVLDKGYRVCLEKS